MSSDSIPLRPPMTRDAVGILLGQTMGLVAVTAGLFAVGAYLGRDPASPWGWLLFIAAFACLIGMNAAGLLIGVATAPTLSYYAAVAAPACQTACGSALA